VHVHTHTHSGTVRHPGREANSCGRDPRPGRDPPSGGRREEKWNQWRGVQV